MEYIFLLLFFIGPAFVSLVVGCTAGVILGKKLYIQSGKRGLSSIFAASLFLILFYLTSKVVSWSVGLVLLDSAGSWNVLGVLGLLFGIKMFVFLWVVKCIGVLVTVSLVYYTKRELSPVLGTEAPRTSFLLKIVPLVVILALMTLSGPLLTLYDIFQVKQHTNQIEIAVKNNQQEYDLIVDSKIQESLSTVQTAIVAFESANNGKPPEKLSQLVPKYLIELPSLQVNTTLGGVYTFDYAVTDPQRNYYRVCILSSKFEAGLTGRSCIDQTGRSSRGH